MSPPEPTTIRVLLTSISTAFRIALITGESLEENRPNREGPDAVDRDSGSTRIPNGGDLTCSIDICTLAQTGCFFSRACAKAFITSHGEHCSSLQFDSRCEGHRGGDCWTLKVRYWFPDHRVRHHGNRSGVRSIGQCGSQGNPKKPFREQFAWRPVRSPVEDSAMFLRGLSSIHWRELILLDVKSNLTRRRSHSSQ